MKLRSGESVTIDILGTASQLIYGTIVLVFRYLAISAALVIAPAVFVVLPLYLLWQDPNGDYGWLGAVVFFAAPWSCAFYMGLFASWEWRKVHSDYWYAAGKSFLYAFGGLVVSYLLEGLYIVVALRFFPVLGGAIAHAVAFESLLITAFLPVILLLIKRWKICRDERAAMQEEALL